MTPLNKKGSKQIHFHTKETRLCYAAFDLHMLQMRPVKTWIQMHCACLFTFLINEFNNSSICINLYPRRTSAEVIRSASHPICISFFFSLSVQTTRCIGYRGVAIVNAGKNSAITASLSLPCNSNSLAQGLQLVRLHLFKPYVETNEQLGNCRQSSQSFFSRGKCTH